MEPSNLFEDREQKQDLTREQARIKVLHHYAVLDTPPEQEFDELAAMAARVCGTPIALISLVDEERQWFKAKVGDVGSETPRSSSFCAHALDSSDILIVPDTQQDERFANNPMVTGEPGIRFYAGAPLLTPHDATLGTLCVIDKVPRVLSPAQKIVLQALARRVVTQLENRSRPKELSWDKKGQLIPGIHDTTIPELRSLVCTNPYRTAMWLRLMSFLGWPVLNGEFSYAYFGGGLISDEQYPTHTSVILQPTAPFGPAGFSNLSKFLLLGLEKIYEMYSIHLHFWMENGSPELSDRKFFQYVYPGPKEFNPDVNKQGVVRIDLRNPEIVSQVRLALDLL